MWLDGAENGRADAAAGGPEDDIDEETRHLLLAQQHYYDSVHVVKEQARPPPPFWSGRAPHALVVSREPCLRFPPELCLPGDRSISNGGPVAAGLPAQAATRRQPAALPAGRRQVPALPVQQQDQRSVPSPTCPCSRGCAGSVPGLCTFPVVTAILSRLSVVQASWPTRWAWAKPSRPSASSCCSWSARITTGPTSSSPPRQAYAMSRIIRVPIGSICGEVTPTALHRVLSRGHGIAALAQRYASGGGLAVNASQTMSFIWRQRFRLQAAPVPAGSAVKLEEGV